MLIVESSVVYSVDTVERRRDLLALLIVVDRVTRATLDWHSVGVLSILYRAYAQAYMRMHTHAIQRSGA